MKGKLIVIEGIDGVGKSTQCKLLGEYLENKGYSVQLLKEPSDGQYGKRIRELAQSGRSDDPDEEYNLFILDRKENVEKNILPSLNQGSIVILDRYYYSTVAYQGAMGVSTSKILQENEEFAPKPDCVVLLDLSVDEALKRIVQYRKDKADNFESRDYLIKVKAIFDQLRDDVITKISSSNNIDEIHRNIVEVIEQKIL